jgi:DNA-binding NarL/FixJ family response regulator
VKTHEENGEMSRSRLRIVIADDSADFLNTIVPMLREKFDVLGTTADGKSALELIKKLQPDVIILDLQMPELSGIEVTRSLMKNGNHSRIIICSVHLDPEIVDAAMAAGALGYVAKTRSAQDLVEAVEAVARGERFTSSTNGLKLKF